MATLACPLGSQRSTRKEVARGSSKELFASGLTANAQARLNHIASTDDDPFLGQYAVALQWLMPVLARFFAVALPSRLRHGRHSRCRGIGEALWVLRIASSTAQSGACNVVGFCQHKALSQPIRRRDTLKCRDGATSSIAAQVHGKCLLNQAIVSDITWPNAGSA